MQRKPHLPAFAAAALLLTLAGCRDEDTRPETGPVITSGDIGEAVLTGTRYFQANGEAPVFVVLPGKATFAAEADGKDVGDADHCLYSNDAKRTDGEVAIEAIDRIGGDEATESTVEKGDEARVEGWFLDADGSKVSFVLERLEPRPVPGSDSPTYFGGVATDVVLHGDTGLGTPLEPKVKARLALWGSGRIEKDGKLLGRAPMHLMVTSRTRSPETGQYLGDHDATSRDVEEVHLVISPVPTDLSSTDPRRGAARRPTEVPAGLPRAGGDFDRGAPSVTGEGSSGLDEGFHVIWSNSDIRFRPF